MSPWNLIPRKGLAAPCLHWFQSHFGSQLENGLERNRWYFPIFSPFLAVVVKGVPGREFRKYNYKVQVPLRTASPAPSDFCDIKGSAPQVHTLSL